MALGLEEYIANKDLTLWSNAGNIYDLHHIRRLYSFEVHLYHTRQFSGVSDTRFLNP